MNRLLLINNYGFHVQGRIQPYNVISYPDNYTITQINTHLSHVMQKPTELLAINDVGHLLTIDNNSIIQDFVTRSDTYPLWSYVYTDSHLPLPDNPSDNDIELMDKLYTTLLDSEVSSIKLPSVQLSIAKILKSWLQPDKIKTQKTPVERLKRLISRLTLILI